MSGRDGLDDRWPTGEGEKTEAESRPEFLIGDVCAITSGNDASPRERAHILDLEYDLDGNPLIAMVRRVYADSEHIPNYAAYMWCSNLTVIRRSGHRYETAARKV